MDEFGLSHNLWLDVLRVGGVIPFVLLLIYSWKAFKGIRKFLRSNAGDITYNFLLIVISTGLFLVFMVEPILDGIVNLFILFCLFRGLLTYPLEEEEPAEKPEGLPSE